MSILPEKQIIQCPCCSSALLFSSPPRGSNKSIVGTWTDGVINENSQGTYAIVICPVCNVFFRPWKAEVIRKIRPVGINQMHESDHNVLSVKPLGALALSQVLDTGFIANAAEELDIRIILWRQINNTFRQEDNHTPLIELQEIRIRNMHMIIELITGKLRIIQRILIQRIISSLLNNAQIIQHNANKPSTLNLIDGDLLYWVEIVGEVHRELGNFQSSIDILSLVDTEPVSMYPFNDLIQSIRTLAYTSNSSLSLVNHGVNET